MLFRLAAHLGRTVGELVSGKTEPLSSIELTYWRAFDVEQPFGDIRNEMHAAMLATTIVNSSGRVMPEGETRQLTDFMWWTRPKGNRPSNVDRIMSTLVRAGAKIVKRGK